MEDIINTEVSTEMNITPFQKLIRHLAARVYESLGPGHNEQIYHKALHHELMCSNIFADAERHLDVTYTDSLDFTHHLVSERIDLFVHKSENSVFEDLNKNPVVIELKAISKILNVIEEVQVKKYFRELAKQGITPDYGILINFPQASSKGVSDSIEFRIVNNDL
jgi:GxxExxY protein